ncbi:MAG TPA: hypothetical protein VF432_20650 [Thermoanaerobaculia bacterium]
MRASTIKSLIAALSISLTVLAAVPADARPAQGAQKTQTTRTREEAPSNDRFAAVRELVRRTLRRIGLQGGITIPVPKDDAMNGEQ